MVLGWGGGGVGASSGRNYRGGGGISGELVIEREEVADEEGGEGRVVVDQGVISMDYFDELLDELLGCQLVGIVQLIYKP